MSSQMGTCPQHHIGAVYSRKSGSLEATTYDPASIVGNPFFRATENPIVVQFLQKPDGRKSVQSDPEVEPTEDFDHA